MWQYRFDCEVGEGSLVFSLITPLHALGPITPSFHFILPFLPPFSSSFLILVVVDGLHCRPSFPHRRRRHSSLWLFASSLVHTPSSSLYAISKRPLNAHLTFFFFSPFSSSISGLVSSTNTSRSAFVSICMVYSWYTVSFLHLFLSFFPSTLALRSYISARLRTANYPVPSHQISYGLLPISLPTDPAAITITVLFAPSTLPPTILCPLYLATLPLFDTPHFNLHVHHYPALSFLAFIRTRSSVAWWQQTPLSSCPRLQVAWSQKN